MKDRLQLILAGGVFGALAWTVWHILGKEAFLALPTAMLIVVIADNVRLRRQLRSMTATQNGNT